MTQTLTTSCEVFVVKTFEAGPDVLRDIVLHAREPISLLHESESFVLSEMPRLVMHENRDVLPHHVWHQEEQLRTTTDLHLPEQDSVPDLIAVLREPSTLRGATSPLFQLALEQLVLRLHQND